MLMETPYEKKQRRPVRKIDNSIKLKPTSIPKGMQEELKTGKENILGKKLNKMKNRMYGTLIPSTQT